VIGGTGVPQGTSSSPTNNASETTGSFARCSCTSTRGPRANKTIPADSAHTQAPLGLVWRVRNRPASVVSWANFGRAG
jgi:hypothetical protein